MEMEFKDSGRRRTVIALVGVMLALAAGAATLYLSSQGGAPTSPLPTREVVVAALPIPARTTIQATDLTLRVVPDDASNLNALLDPSQAVGRTTAVTIYQFQPITPNLLASTTSGGSVAILKPTETISPFSPIWRAVSFNVPPERAVGGLLAVGQRVDVLATIPINVTLPIDEDTGDPVESEFLSETSTKLAWLDMEILQVNPDSGSYVLKADLHQSEEIAHAQNAGAAFTLLLRPDGDNRDVDRSTYGETNNRIVEQYNFPLPEVILALEYPQPSTFPSPFPNEPYLSPAPSPSASPLPGESAEPSAPPEP